MIFGIYVTDGWDFSGVITETVNNIPVNIGAVELKKYLFAAILPNWSNYTHGFPLRIEDVTMRDKNWVCIKPENPDQGVIAEEFSKPGKGGVLVFKAVRCVVHLHVPNKVRGQEDLHILSTDKLKIRFTRNASCIYQESSKNRNRASQTIEIQSRR